MMVQAEKAPSSKTVGTKPSKKKAERKEKVLVVDCVPSVNANPGSDDTTPLSRIGTEDDGNYPRRFESVFGGAVYIGPAVASRRRGATPSNLKQQLPYHGELLFHLLLRYNDGI